jgi:hypothetical protein
MANIMLCMMQQSDIRHDCDVLWIRCPEWEHLFEHWKNVPLNLLTKIQSCGILIPQTKCGTNIPHMREWLSGRASPCQGESRGFDPRLPLPFSATSPSGKARLCKSCIQRFESARRLHLVRLKLQLFCFLSISFPSIFPRISAHGPATLLFR